MKYGIRVMPKKDVLDSQGRAVKQVLERGGFSLSECKVGRYVEIESEKNKDELLKMADYVLFNPLIEDIEVFEVEA